MVKVLVIGGGFAGCCAAHLLSAKGWSVTLVETAPFLGGGNKTLHYGGHPYTFGPRHFLTEDEKLFEFLNQYVPLRQIGLDHVNLSYIESDQRFYHWPIHQDDVEQMPDYEQISDELRNVAGVSEARNFEEYWIGSVGKTLYGKFAETYSKKMWKVEDNTELDSFAWAPEGVQTRPTVAINTGPKAAWDRSGVISAFPYAMNGYDDYFDIATRDTEVILETRIESFDLENHRVKLGGEWRNYDIIISTISPEIVLNNEFGPLRWVGRDFIKIVLPVEQVFPPNVFFLYYANEEPFTRIVEYKKFYQYDSPTTLLGLEIPSFSNKLYPFPSRDDQITAQKYFDALPENVFSIGRAGSYDYGVDIDDCIRQCLDLASKL